jgi:poly(hydroxyalkanoate) granule-associated protein
MKKAAKKAMAVRPMIMESAQQIWLAGLGAFATAGQEGNKLFQQLVKRGHEVQKAGRGQVRKFVAKAEDLREDAEAAVGKFRLPLDKGMTKAMHRLGVPTRTEILELTRRVEALTKAVEKKNGRRRKAATKAAAASAA